MSVSKRKIFSIIIFCAVLPALVTAGYFLTKGRQFLLMSLIVAAAAMLPFFLSLERKKLQVRELVITASVIALSAASRTAFFFLPQMKPMCAVLIMAAVPFGSEFGFITGALSMLVSNIMYGQGMWTPFQMLGMGMTVFVSSLIIRRCCRGNRFAAGITGGLACFVCYGLTVDTGSALMMLTKFTPKAMLSVYLSGVTFNVIHAVTTAVLIALFFPAINEKLDRIKIKYGLFGEKQ